MNKKNMIEALLGGIFTAVLVFVLLAYGKGQPMQTAFVEAVGMFTVSVIGGYMGLSRRKKR